MPTLDATVGGASSNSFATQAEGTTYCDTRLNASAWTTASSADKDRALISATRELNTLTYIGYAVSETQALTWPRQYAEIPPEDATVTSLWYDTTEIPQRVKDATCELALQYLIAGTTDLSAIPATQGVIEKTIGPITTRWADPYYLPQTIVERFPLVDSLIAPLLVKRGNSVPTVRG